MALLPIGDDHKLKSISFQFVTVGLIATCVAVFLWQLTLGEEQARFIYGLGTVPSVLFGTRDLPPELSVLPAPLTLLSSLFLHGGWAHLGFNMLFLWVFGDNVEDSMGHLRFLVFYLVCGALATLTHAFFAANSISPLIGASGAISGVLGAYLVLHPRARLLVLFLHIIPLRLPAWVVLLGWIGFQFFNLQASIAGTSDSNVAWWAHIGGFAAGMVLIVIFRRKSVPLLDGVGRFHPKDDTDIMLEERRHQRSIFPNTYRPEHLPRRGPWG